MEHRRLGNSGLQVSVLSFGSWVTFDTQLDDDLALQCMQAAWDAGATFFDNAEAYAGGESEAIMGRALQRLGWHRDTYTVSTKFYWGITDGPNSRNTLNRKYLMSAMEQSLDRFQLDVIDLIFCHRSDPNTPMEEVVRAMSDIVSSGRAHYWGTSEWSGDEIRSAFEVAERYGLHKPVMEQPQYNMLNRERVEDEYSGLYTAHGYGLTTWSPLASGALTGKYLDGVPEGSRASLPGYEWLADRLTSGEQNELIGKLVDVASDLGCSPAQLAIAWCAKNPNVSTVITGASKPAQVVHNMEAADVIERLDGDVMARIASIIS